MPLGFLYAPPAIEQPVIINKDSGGVVSIYEDAVAKYNLEGRRVEIRGGCHSACTMALAVKNVCVGPNAEVAWHQAYTESDHKIRSDVTQHMVDMLPYKVRNYINGKIQIDYTPETILNHDKLVALGIPDCDSQPYSAPTTTAQVKTTLTYQPTNIPSPQPSVATEADQKNTDWQNYWDWAVRTSQSQFGNLRIKQFRIKNGSISQNIYYWDKQGNYVTAIQYMKNGYAYQRRVCRAQDSDADEMTCTDFDSGKVTYVEFDEFTNSYREARN